jgi:hypothetical protein
LIRVSRVLACAALPLLALSISAASANAWTVAYRTDFTSMDKVNAFQSPASVNDTLSSSDSSNAPLQKPTVSSNVHVVSDSGATDGKALEVDTRQANYQTSSGTKFGWANGRFAISGQTYAPPVRVSVRLRMTASIHTKTAVMWWPSGGGWPWEVDFAETFGGDSLSDYWGGRQHVSQRWHYDTNGDGSAKEQLPAHDDTLDATKYHTYTLNILKGSMFVEIDGVKKYSTTNTAYIPKTAGFFTIGKALTTKRSATHTNDAIFADWLTISTGGPSSTDTDPPPPPSTTVPDINGLAATPMGSGRIDLDWTPTAASIDTYQVRWAPTGTTNWTYKWDGLTSPSLSVTGLVPGGEYDFEVRMRAPGGAVGDWSQPITASDHVEPAVPSTLSGIKAAKVSSGKVKVSWNASSAAVDTYQVRWRKASGTSYTTKWDGIGVTNYTVTGLSSGVKYMFSARVRNNEGDVSDWSSEVAATA